MILFILIPLTTLFASLIYTAMHKSTYNSDQTTEPSTYQFPIIREIQELRDRIKDLEEKHE